MLNFQELENKFQRALGMKRKPVAVSFLDAIPTGIAAFTGTMPSGCSFWLKKISRMYKKVHSWFLFLLFLLTGHFVRAQDTATGKPVEMADRLRADGKIYVVIVVLLTIFLGIVAYVIRLDRKISRLEKGGK